MPAVNTPAKLPSLIQSRSSKTEAATQRHYPFSDLDMQDGIMDQLSLAGTPTVQRTTTTSSKVRRSRVSSANHASIITVPARGTPIASPPADYVAVADTTFMAQLPTMGPNAALQIMAQLLMPAHDNGACSNQRQALLAPASTSANASLQRRDRSIPIPHRARSAETASPTAPLPHRPPAPPPPHLHLTEILHTRVVTPLKVPSMGHESRTRAVDQYRGRRFSRSFLWLPTGPRQVL